MNTKPLSASRLELAATCPGSYAHEHIETTNEAAERGSAVHDYIAAILQGKDNLLPKDEKTAALCRLLDRSELMVRATPNGHDKLLVEQALYLLPTSLSGLPGEAGLLEGDYHRDYSGAPEGALVGTADVIAVEEDGVAVTDWKTGRGEVAHPADNYQLKFLGLAAARSFGKEKATVQIGAIRTDGSIDTSSHTMEAEELQEIASELARIGRRVEAARNGDPVYKTGLHCRLCPALANCPAVAGAAQAIMDGPPEELTPTRAAELFRNLQAVEAASKQMRESLREYVYARPVPTSEGKQLTVKTQTNEKLDTAKALPVIRQYLPDDETISEVVTINKSGLSNAFSKEANKQIMAELKEAGAVYNTYSEQLREEKS